MSFLSGSVALRFVRGSAVTASLAWLAGIASCSVGQGPLFGDPDAAVSEIGDTFSGLADSGVLQLKCPSTITASVVKLADDVSLDRPIEVAARKDWAWVMYHRRWDYGGLVNLETYHFPLASWREGQPLAHVTEGGPVQLTVHGDDAASVAAMLEEEGRRALGVFTQADTTGDGFLIQVESNEVLTDMTRTSDGYIFSFHASTDENRLLFYDVETMSKSSLSQGPAPRESYLLFASPILWVVDVLPDSLFPFYLTRMRGEEEDQFEVFGSCPSLSRVTKTDFAAVDGERLWMTWRCGDERFIHNKSARLSEESYWIDDLQEYHLQLAHDGATVGVLRLVASNRASISFYDPHDSSALSGSNLTFTLPVDPQTQLIHMDLAGSLSPDGKTTRWVAAFAFETDTRWRKGTIYAATFTGCSYE